MLRLIPRLVDDIPEALLGTGLPPQLARVLYARGVHTAQEAQAFLHPSVDGLHDPFLLRDMDKAVERIRAAMAAGEPIVVYGDYDVDGVSATSVLVEALKDHGAQAEWYIPSRHKEGYGLNKDAVQALAQKAKLLITVDCGITSVEEADLASFLGLDVIITDHHEPPEQLPQAVAVIDPLLGDYPFRRLCGAGVALKLAWALFGQEAVENLWELAALATVADLVPLLGENRIIVSEGLRRIAKTQRPGLRALITVAGLDGKVITAGHLGFQLGPRINAGGRLYEASRNVDLLLTQNPEEARSIAEALNSENSERQRMEKDIVQKATQWVEGNVDFLKDRALLVAGEDWNTGVVGLAASRLVERFAWPAVVLAKSDKHTLTGSARSVPGVNIHRALTLCGDLFTRFGGHSQAAGMTLPEKNLPELRRRLNEAIASIAEPDAFVPSAPYDLDITLPEVTIPLIELLDQLAPTGFGNPSPVFRLSGARVLEARGVGADGKHLKLRLEQEGTALDGIAFGQGAERAGMPERVDVLFSPSVNEYMGKRSAQCEVARILPHAPLEAFEAECRARANAFDLYWVGRSAQELVPMDEKVVRPLLEEALRASCQGTLMVVKTLQGALAWSQWLREAGLADRVDYCFGAPADPRRFNTLCALPREDAGQGFEAVYALDDPWAVQAVNRWLPSDEGLRGLYKVLRSSQGRFATLEAMAEAAELPPAAAHLGLIAFEELSLAEYRRVPFTVKILPAQKCALEDSGTLRMMRSAWMQEGKQ